MAASNAQKLGMLNHRFGGPDLTRPATLYFGFSSTQPAEGGTNVTEPVGNNYARVPVTNNATNFPAATMNGNVAEQTNGTDILFAAASPAGWGIQTHVVIFDALTGGVALAWYPMTPSKDIEALEEPKFSAGTLTITSEKKP